MGLRFLDGPQFPCPGRVSTPSLMINISLCPESTPDGSPHKKTCGLSVWASFFFLCPLWSDPDLAPWEGVCAMLPSIQALLTHCCGCATTHPSHNRHTPKPSSVLRACRDGSATVLPSIFHLTCNMAQGHRSLLVKDITIYSDPF